MKTIRTLSGILALLGVIVALNVVLLAEAFFLAAVMVPLGIGLLAAVVWLACTLILYSSSVDRRKRFQGVNAIIASAIVFGICVALYALSGRIDASWDLTREGRRDLSEHTIRVLETLEKDVEVIGMFLDVGDWEIDIARQKTGHFLDRCQEHTAHLSYRFVDPQRDVELLRAMGITHSSPRGTVVINCEGRKRAVSLSGEPARLQERDFVNALLNVVRASNIRVGFLGGHGERTDTKRFRMLLEQEAYIVDDVFIRANEPEVPSDCDILVIDGLKGDFDGHEIGAFQAFLDDGGRLLLLVDPLIPAEGGPVPRLVFLSWLEQRYGIQVGDDLLLSSITDSLGLIELEPDNALLDLFEKFPVPDVDFTGCYDSDHPITRGFNQVIRLDGARSVTAAKDLPEGVFAAEILRTRPYAWAEKRLHMLMGQNRVPPKPDPDERKGNIGVAVAATAKSSSGEDSARAARIVVVGDSEITSDESVWSPGHLSFLLNTMAWLSEHEELIAIRATGTEDQPIILTAPQEQAVVWTSTLGVFQAVALAGLAAWLIRRKYR